MPNRLFSFLVGLSGLSLGVLLLPAAAQAQPPETESRGAAKAGPEKSRELKDALKDLLDAKQKLLAKEAEIAKLLEEAESQQRALKRENSLLRAALKESHHVPDTEKKDAAPPPKKITRLPNVDAPATMRQRNATVLQLLGNSANTSKLQDITLKDALEYFQDGLRAQALDLRFSGTRTPLFEHGEIPILVNKQAFVALLGPDARDLYTEKVSLPPTPNKMQLQLALRLVLSQVADGKASYVVRRGYVEIVPLEHTTASHMLTQSPLFVSFDQRPLPEVLQAFADETGLAINLDPSAGPKGKTPISAAFRNSTLEDALVTVTEMAGLKLVILERSVLVTTPDRVESLRAEEKARAKNRK